MASPPPPPPPLIQEDTSYSTTKVWPRVSCRRTPSFSSSSASHSRDSSLSSFSFNLNDESPPHSPTTPLKPKGIPFSWEQVPGIPKHRYFKNKETPLTHLLPLPPARNTTKKLKNQDENIPKKHYTCKDNSDPFLAALMACSTDDEHPHDHGGIWRGTNSKVCRTLSDRIGLINMYTSCKKTCDVSKSVSYIPKTLPQYQNLHHHR